VKQTLGKEGSMKHRNTLLSNWPSPKPCPPGDWAALGWVAS
jgi:hypothetical protein